MDHQAALDAASELLQLMIGRATTSGLIYEPSFQNARQIVLKDPVGKRHAPECVRICRDPDAVWSYIKSQDPELSTYESRRRFLRKEFEPLLAALEQNETSPLDSLVSGEATTLNATTVEEAWDKALERRNSDPEGAVTSARTLLESTCKTLMEDRGIDYRDRDDLPRLYRTLAGSLGIAPSEHTEEQFKAILGACNTIVQELGSLRNRVSDSHGPGRKSYRPKGRHAALAVNLAGSMALFLIQTHEANPP